MITSGVETKLQGLNSHYPKVLKELEGGFAGLETCTLNILNTSTSQEGYFMFEQ